MKRQLFVPTDQVAATLIVTILSKNHMMLCLFLIWGFFPNIQMKERFMTKYFIHTAKLKA